MKKYIPIIIGLLFLFSCKSIQTGQSSDDGQLEFIFLQLNDVYELTPGQNDDLGGLARVATLKKQLMKETPNVFAVLAGDFISPSVYSTTRFQGSKIRGLQIIESFNAMGLDMCCFGNHEFDYKLADLQKCLDASNFTWLASNVFLKTKSGAIPFYKNTESGKEDSPAIQIMTLKDADGTSLRVGMFTATLDVNPKPWLVVDDPYSTAQDMVAQLTPKTDVIIGLTHLFLDQDSLLATQVPSVPLLMGGHEHDGHFLEVGKTKIAKARSNAKSVYIHRITHHLKTNRTAVRSEEVRIDASFDEDPATALTVKKWENILEKSLHEQGFNPDKVVVELGTPLDCRDEFLRNNQAPFGNMLTTAMIQASKNKPDCALFNSGTVRYDDYIDGQITELDVIKLLPYGGGFSEVEMRGSLLQKVLIGGGDSNKSHGGYLQLNGCGYNAGAKEYQVKGEKIDPEAVYMVALPDFLLTGLENGIEFLKASPTPEGTTNPDVLKIHRPSKSDKGDVRADIRQTLMEFLR